MPTSLRSTRLRASDVNERLAASNSQSANSCGHNASGYAIVLAELVEQLARRLHVLSHHADLKPAQWSFLRYLLSANESSRTVTFFAQYNGLSLSSASQTLRSLEEKRLVVSHVSKEDRRIRYLKLTTKAHKVLNTDPLRQVATAIHNLETPAQKHLSLALEAIVLDLYSYQKSDDSRFCDAIFKF
ncbi:MAG: MarR family transcriptional regulator [Rhodospirillaceae bacterium]|nr:MarR family transcriptional regulator [Rhodospirillaceae bacterium]